MSADETTDLIERDIVKNDPAIGKILERYFADEISGPVALMQLLIETEDVGRVRGVVGAVAGRASKPGPTPDRVRRARELEALLVANADGCARIAAMLRADVDSSKQASSVEEGIAFSERLFDWSVQQSEESSVALYSLGNPALLERATAEIVAQLKAWGAVTKDTTMLDLGCGIGRLLIALSPEVKAAVGIDVSSGMVKAARRRCASHSNVTVSKADGRGLGEFTDASFDLVLAVDSFPYIRQSGYALAERFFAEAARVLRSGGELVILNYSYSEDDESDAGEVRTLAAANRLKVLVSGERPFDLWDGVAFRLVRDRL